MERTLAVLRLKALEDEMTAKVSSGVRESGGGWMGIKDETKQQNSISLEDSSFLEELKWLEKRIRL